MKARQYILLALVLLVALVAYWFYTRGGQHGFTQRSPVCHEEMDCARGDFETYFHVWKDSAPGETTKLKSADRSISLTSLSAILGPAPNPDKTGIRMHYGLSGSSDNYHLELALEVVELVERGHDHMFYDVVDNNNTVWFLDNNPDHAPTGVSKADWSDGQHKLYLTTMAVIRSKGGQFDHLLKDFDHRAMTYRLSDINTLITHNNAPLGKVKYIKFSSLANPITRGPVEEEDWRHELALIALDNNKVELLGEPDPHQPIEKYTMKALDLGSPCPPSCVMAVFHTYGLAPRPGCACP